MTSYQKLKEQRNLLAKKYKILHEACRKFVKEDKDKDAWLIIVNALMEDANYLL